MKITAKILVGSITSVAFLLPGPSSEAKEARVTQIIREVKLLPADAAAREAALNDKVSEDTGVRTGGDSRSELTFPDLTITRLGANTIFSFSKSGRTANVDTGSILLRVPKDSGGGTIRSSAVTVAVTGTTVIFEGSRGGRSKLITLEGSSRVSLKKNPKEFRKVLAGQMIDVPAGATTLPMPVNVDLNQIMRTHPLITDFKPLPSQPLIMAAAQQPQPEPPPPSYSGPTISIVPVINFGPNRDPHPTRTPHPVTNQPPGTTRPPTTNKQPPPTPTAPPILTRTNPKQTYSPPPTKTTTRIPPKVTKKPTPTPPPIR
jgi:FecR protein